MFEGWATNTWIAAGSATGAVLAAVAAYVALWLQWGMHPRPVWVLTRGVGSGHGTAIRLTNLGNAEAFDVRVKAIAADKMSGDALERVDRLRYDERITLSLPSNRSWRVTLTWREAPRMKKVRHKRWRVELDGTAEDFNVPRELQVF